MSYLTAPIVPSFSKAVISFWYKVPQASLDAAANDPITDPMSGFVPLVIMGKEGTATGQLNVSGQSVEYPWSNSSMSCRQGYNVTFSGPCETGLLIAHETAFCVCTTASFEGIAFGDKISYSASSGPPSAPSYIALDGGGNIQINLESTMFGDAILASVETEFKPEYTTGASGCQCITFSDNFPCINGSRNINMIVLTPIFCVAIYPPEEFEPFPGDSACTPTGGTTTEKSATYGSPPTSQLSSAAIGFSSNQAGVTPAADKWHHVLISIDLTGGSASRGTAVGEISPMASRITATSTLYIAIDDVNYPTGGNLFPGTNKVVVTVAENVADQGQAENFVTNMPEGPIPSYSIGPMSIPAAPLGIPGTAKYSNKIHQVEMAEFQMWTGVTLDTSVVSNRRLFIDSKGRPVDPNLIETLSMTAIGDPATWEPGADIPTPPLVPDTSALGAIAPKQLGKPILSLTRSDQNWITGHNLGTLKGKLARTGKIKSYRPDPQLGK